ncbi:GNAT family N-acetyltransferase [Pseudomonas aegrilactucae]|uniref:GNAT family N-acetyltransferase n=1 Tax=Pseudomonas aegrilactucae TaxID=2854028 RepID=A0A9Q3AF87_9PSED|nr:GNAT family N-acetyltransferase [Pseudomonas aegrilactucae]MBV6288783.1 GNAT family N-acetyltransferase [Pseudomonas aegrilactucae]
MTYSLQHLEDTRGFAASFDVMRVLRPQVTDVAAYVAQLLRQAEQGYRLLAACDGEQVVGLAGYRLLENLLYGRFIYVDDLVVSPALQRSGLGAQLLGAVREEAVQHGCDHFVLDTGLHMPLAQRFYFRQGLLARGMHFTQRLRPGSPA